MTPEQNSLFQITKDQRREDLEHRLTVKELLTLSTYTYSYSVFCYKGLILQE